jgi:hypothetical protein
MQRCRTFFCALLLHAVLSYSLRFAAHAALSYFLRFAASCSFVVLSALRCFMQCCRTLCALLLMQRCRTFFCASLFMQRCRTLCASLPHAALSSYFLLRFAASCSVVVLSTICALFPHAELSYFLLRFAALCSVVVFSILSFAWINTIKEEANPIAFAFF